MPALCSILNSLYYANNYAGIFDAGLYIINGERFAGLNFRGFRHFEKDCESFSTNILHEL